MLVQLFMSRDLLLRTLLSRISFGYLVNSLLRISLSRIFKKGREFFRFKPYEKSFEKSTTFHGKFARTKDDFRRILFALLLHNTVRKSFITAS